MDFTPLIFIISCQPCPVDELESPVCKPFNNRQLFRCHLTTSNSNQDFNLMWHSCGKLPNVERNTFIKFIVSLIVFQQTYLRVLSLCLYSLSTLPWQ